MDDGWNPVEQKPAQPVDDIGLVVIGRNEGERLRDCLTSLQDRSVPIIYVDSGSTDGSQDLALTFGAQVHALDMRKSFTAARARNAGFKLLLRQHPEISYVQFLDGDCRLAPVWLATAAAFLRTHEDVALVFGRRRERFPLRSIYNAICDHEWAGAPGETTECGGDILIRVEDLLQAGGYNEQLIAGEEPELCVRLREKGKRIWRLDHDMSLHDADILSFKQWWRRSVRTGHAYAEVHLAHLRSPFAIWGTNLRRTLFWSALLPASAAGAVLLHPACLLALLLYPAQLLRLWRREGSVKRAALNLLGKFAELQGVVQYGANRLAGHQPLLIEYK
jgi:glycosyltransferase involved in cell wall biosynthesis